MNIKLNNIAKKYEGMSQYTLKYIDLEFEDNDFVVILGPSGCGKTTLLRMIAGLNSITSGDLLFDGRRVNELEPADRKIAMVFQNYALYPHMTVFDNLAFGLKMRKAKKAFIAKKVQEVAKLLNISEHLYKKPKALSGGQQQRVAIGRAVVREPKVFLMDEPLSNLDAKLREYMRKELVRIHRLVGSTSIYVTHDQLEAMSMATKIVLMNDGVVQQVGSPRELYSTPANVFTAKFVGAPEINIWKGTVKSNIFKEANGEFEVDLTKSAGKKIPNGEYKFGVRSEIITLSSKATKAKGSMKAKIEIVELQGKDNLIVLEKGKQRINVSLLTSSSADFKVGQDVTVTLDPNNIHIFDSNDENIKWKKQAKNK